MQEGKYMNELRDWERQIYVDMLGDNIRYLNRMKAFFNVTKVMYPVLVVLYLVSAALYFVEGSTGWGITMLVGAGLWAWVGYAQYKQCRSYVTSAQGYVANSQRRMDEFDGRA